MLTNTETSSPPSGSTAVALADVSVVPEVSLQGWADRITHALGRSVEAILDVGRLMLAVKKAKDHGEWEKCFKGHPQAVANPVRFSVGTAKMYMKIAVHPVLSNRNLSYDLPPSWKTLHELTFLPESELDRLIATGVIAPDMRKADAVMLRYMFASPPHRRMPRKHVARHLRAYATPIESLETAQAILRQYAATVAAELRAPLTIGEDGRVQSGVCWVPPFAQPWQIHVKPIKAMHRCECGHIHEDRRTKP